MADQTAAKPKRKRSWLRYAAIALGAVVLVAIGSVLVAQRLSDGPLWEMIPGGALRAGEWVAESDIVWSELLGDKGSCVNGVCAALEPIELQLVDPPHSRYTGIMLHDGQAYVPCDLGFMWARFSGSQRRILHLIYIFKTWHEDAERDGRVVLRIDGKRYEGEAVRVTEPGLIAELRSELEEMAKSWLAPQVLPPAPTEHPNDIWFFRIDPGQTTRS